MATLTDPFPRLAGSGLMVGDAPPVPTGDGSCMVTMGSGELVQHTPDTVVGESIGRDHDGVERSLFELHPHFRGRRCSLHASIVRTLATLLASPRGEM
ncbi:MAG: hypothetical protein ACYCV7_09015 [Acidimicrobiales bacterium]